MHAKRLRVPRQPETTLAKHSTPGPLCNMRVKYDQACVVEFCVVRQVGATEELQDLCQQERAIISRIMWT
jgi:hypothetical protein